MAVGGAQQATAGLGTEGFQTSVPAASVGARLASRSLSVARSGAVSIKITCSETAGRCQGTLSLETLTTLSAARADGASKRAMLTLAQAPFSLAGGKTTTITLHLSAKGRALLARSRTLSAVATMIVRDPSGAMHRTATTVTLRAATRLRTAG